MIDTDQWKLLIFLRDFTGRGEDVFYWLEDNQLREVNAKQVVEYSGATICHDFWTIRDILFDKTQDLPAAIIDLDEFRISVSGKSEDRQSREILDISDELGRYGATSETCSTYKKMFNRGVEFDALIACEVANAMERMYLDLREQSRNEGEFERFFAVEVPVYRLLQRAMSVGITVNAAGLSDRRSEAEYDYFFCLKNYSAKHDMPLETPTHAAIEDKLQAVGFDLNGVSIDYVLEFLPHEQDFGHETIALREFDAAKRMLSSLALSSSRTRPIIDVFGSRTSRIHLRSPSLQNMPRKYRSIIRARAGAALCYVDFDQYEVGIMAALSEDVELTALYGEGDMYSLFATKHLGLNGNRKVAKQLFLSYAYGMSRKALIDAAVSLGADRARAKSAFRLFHKYEDWKKEIWAEFQSNSRIATAEGNQCKRSGGGQLSPKEQRSAISQVIQGTASLIFRRLFCELEAWRMWPSFCQCTMRSYSSTAWRKLPRRWWIYLSK